MRYLVILIVWISCANIALAQDPYEMHQEVIADTSGLWLELSSLCSEKGHGRGIYYKHYDLVEIDTITVDVKRYRRVTDRSYSLYKCPRCGKFYRYPHAAYKTEVLIDIGRAQP